MTPELHLGTCSWKFKSWRGLVYSEATDPTLREYARHYSCVEIDQWFYSLFKNEVVLSDPGVVADYAAAAPPHFRFGVKLPNALTLTHVPDKTGSPQPNPHFLSHDMLRAFLEHIQPLKPNLGPLMFQFGYLNAGMMSSQHAFTARLGAFAGHLPSGYTWCVETRNPGYLNADYFTFLRDHNLAHVWQQGYFMPSIFDLYGRFADHLTDTVVMRFHGEDREGVEKRSNRKWSQLTDPRDAELDALAGLLKDLQVRKRKAWAFVNNHYEGCAPLTLERIRQRLEPAPPPLAGRLNCTPIPHGSPEYAATVALRNDVLRKPLGLLFSDEQLQDESRDHHLACYLDGRLVACLILTPLSASAMQMRQVAVAPESQGRGIGRTLVLFAERYAAEHGRTEITAHARLSALPFYAKLGYTRFGAPFTELGLPHVGIRKSVK